MRHCEYQNCLPSEILLILHFPFFYFSSNIFPDFHTFTFYMSAFLHFPFLNILMLLKYELIILIFLLYFSLAVLSSSGVGWKKKTKRTLWTTLKLSRAKEPRSDKPRRNKKTLFYVRNLIFSRTMFFSSRFIHVERTKKKYYRDIKRLVK